MTRLHFSPKKIVFSWGSQSDLQQMNVLSISSSISPCCWSNFDDFDDQVKPSPALKMWLHEGSNLYPKMAQCNGAKSGVLHGTLKKFLRPGRGVSILYKIQSTKIN